eukprot:scaffold10196_cov15-Prasinocladus_malaysianus.AAC.2
MNCVVSLGKRPHVISLLKSFRLIACHWSITAREDTTEYYEPPAFVLKLIATGITDAISHVLCDKLRHIHACSVTCSTADAIEDEILYNINGICSR